MTSVIVFGVILVVAIILTVICGKWIYRQGIRKGNEDAYKEQEEKLNELGQKIYDSIDNDNSGISVRDSQSEFKNISPKP